MVLAWAEVDAEDKKRKRIIDSLIAGGLRENANKGREPNENIGLWQRGLWKEYNRGSFSQRDSGKKK